MEIDVAMFIQKVAQEANDPVFGKLGTRRTPQTSMFMTSTQQDQFQKPCPACNVCHSIFKCAVFKE